jgi:beta-lactam-binding protein with PASTA domain
MPEHEDLERELKEAKTTIRIKDQKIVKLNEEIQVLKDQVATLQRQRPKLKPENLATSFRTALEKMQEGLTTAEGRADYVVGRFDTDLKINVTLDEEDCVSFQLPGLEDIIPAENLSTLHLSFKPVPRVPVPPPETGEVPNLIGLFRDAAQESVHEAQFKVGAIKERVSARAPGVVIGQDPAPYTRMALGSPIDVTISRPREVKVPNVLGMERDTGIEVIKSVGLLVGEVTEHTSDSPPGTIIGQSVAADTTVSLATPIDLAVAKPELVAVPDLAGKTLTAAKKKIEKAKLAVGEVTEKTSGAPAGTVLGQEPEAGVEVPIGTSVDLVVAKPETTAVPNVVGMKRQEAGKAIERAKLKVGTVIQKVSPQPPETVISQKPVAQKEVPILTSVDLTVSKPKTVVVPDCAGMTEVEAKKVLADQGLVVSEVVEKRSRKPKGTVIGQEPKAGMKVASGTSVTLGVSRGFTPASRG